ncbi:MAG: hypothetical protein QM776_13565 [Rhodocyclaceae bacterium]
MISSLVVCGIGRLGLPLALNFERAPGLQVSGYDVNAAYVEALSARRFISDEPGVTQMLAASKLQFSADIAAVLGSELAVVCVRTDSDSSGAYDLGQLWSFVETLTHALSKSAGHALSKSAGHALRALAINCNVNPGTSRRIATALSSYGIEVYFWPEWVKQGSIVEDQQTPPVTVIGSLPGYQYYEEVLAVLTNLDRTGHAPVRSLGLTEAEICKISLNCFLTVKISFANMVATLLDELGLAPGPVLEALGHDPRIGGAFLKPGFGYGGPCLPRDNQAMTAFASQYGISMPLCDAADQVNLQRHQHLSRQAVRDFHAEGIEPALDSLSYKPGVPIFTESQQLRFATQMGSLGIPVHVSDELSVERLKTLPEGEGLLIAQRDTTPGKDKKD